MQINLHHCRDAGDALLDYINKNDIDIVLGQDPYLCGGSVGGIPRDWPTYLSSNLNAFVTTTNKDYVGLEILKLSNSVFISLMVKDSVIYIGSQYSAPSGDLEEYLDEWSGVFKDFDNLVIGGDFNVPLLSLGYTRENDRTVVLMEHLLMYSLSICNDPEAPSSFVQGSLLGRPDLTLLGLNWCDKIEGWLVDKNFSFSDHRYIVFKLDFDPLTKANRRFKTKNKSLYKFNRLLEFKYKDWINSLSGIHTGGLR